MRLRGSTLLFFSLAVLTLSLAKSEDATAVLLERVKALWEAKIEGNWEKVYSFTTDEFRRSVSLEEFKKNRGDVIIATFAIKNIQLDKGGNRAQVDLEYTAIVSAFPFKNLKAKEEWILDNGQWRIDYSNPKSIKALFGTQPPSVFPPKN